VVRRHGRLRRGRSRATACGASAFSWGATKTIEPDVRISRIRLSDWLHLEAHDGPEQKRRLSAITQALADLGWTESRNVRIDLRWGGADNNRIRALAPELVSLNPDIILTVATPAIAAVQRETRTIPIVFATTDDPVASGIVARLDRSEWEHHRVRRVRSLAGRQVA
jgi:putative ABC transport system substrate-binding protein